MLKRSITHNSALLLSLLLLVLSAKPVSAADWIYSIRPGDTLWSVCQHYAKEPNCWQKLGPFNKIDRNRKIPLGTRIRMPAAWLKTPAASATIIFTQGNVTYQHDGETKADAKKGVKLPVGSALTTGEGTVTILFADGSNMVLEPHSQLVLDTLSSFKLNGMVDSSVRLNRGTVKTRVIKRAPRSQFRTITPSAVASVRGTEYRVNAITTHAQTDHDTGKVTKTKESTLVEVYEGLVDVGAEKTTYPVPATFGIVTEQGQAPQPPVRLLEKPTFLPFKTNQTLVTIPSPQEHLTAITGRPLRIAWQAMTNAAEFQLNILADQNIEKAAEQLLRSYRVTDTRIDLTNLRAGCYQLSLRAIDAIGLHGLAAQEKLCLIDQLDTPVLKTSAPLEGQRKLAHITWQNIPGALTYHVDISEHADFSSLLHSLDVNETHYSLEHPSALFFRAQARDQNGTLSQFSPTLHWQPQKEIVQEEDPEYWPIYLQIGLFLLALL